MQLMFKLQPLEKKTSLFCTDVQKMTPLHCAAMFDHPELVEYLVKLRKTKRFELVYLSTDITGH